MVVPPPATFPSPAWETFSFQLGEFGGKKRGEGDNLYPKYLGFLTILL